MYKIGVMGGKRGSAFIRVLQYMDNAECVALCETNKAVLNMDGVKEYLTDKIKIYNDYDEFVRSGLDAVILCNCFHEHAEYAIKAFEAGVAVLCETTAAVSLGDCVRLVEKCEEYQGTYMLVANCIYQNAIQTMKKRIDDDKTGKVLYGEAEYLHHSVNEEDGPISSKESDWDNLHWRKIMPPNMYNMHTLGPLMYATNSMPLTVSCKMIRDNSDNRLTDCIGSVVVTQMSNGAVFQTTGCNYFGSGKWYRLACEKETMETKRYDEKRDKLIVSAGEGYQEEVGLTQRQSGLIEEEDEIDLDHVNSSGHGGVDYYVLYRFLRVLDKKEQPFFDVYRSVALSAVGILGWYSALTDGKELKIPDFTKKEDRDTVREDYRSPFAKRDSEWWIPYRIGEKEKFSFNY